MFKYIPVSRQVRKLQNENAALSQESRQNRADLDFVAAMCDVEIPDEEEETAESEVSE